MIVARQMRAYSSPPPPRTRIQDNPTLLVSWWCTAFALAIILVRLAGRFIRTEKLFKEDKIMALSIIPLLLRMGLVHVVLIWGTNNTADQGMTSLEIHHREIGSKLVLMSRIMYAMFIWIAKFTITEFLKRLTSHVWKRSYEIGLQFIRWFLIVTFFGVVVATLAECHPFSHYWQVVPDPGAQCRQGTAQLFTMGTADIVTDLLIVGFPIPIVLKSTMALQRKLSLVLLFALSLVLVGITVYRVEGVTIRHSSQQFRSLLASLEILAAAAVSNALVLGSFARDRGTKKPRYRFDSTGGHSSLDRTATAPKRVLTAKTWGSDADLAGDVGMRLDPELAEESLDGPRPAPVATLAESDEDIISSADSEKKWTYPIPTVPETVVTDLEPPMPDHRLEGLTPEAMPDTPRRMSFFDVGSLLGDNDGLHLHSRRGSVAIAQSGPPRSDSTLDHHPPSNPTTDSWNMRGSQILLQDIGGLLPSSPRASTPRAADPRPEPSSRKSGLIEALQSTPPSTSARPSTSVRRPRGRFSGLQDVGGLLS